MSKRTELAFFGSLLLFTEAKICVEVGVAKGSGTAALCRAAEKSAGHVYGFDAWSRHGLKNQFGVFSSLEAVEQKLKGQGLSNFTLTKINTHSEKARFEEALDKLCPTGIDFAFIDGCHSYFGIKNDFSVIYPRLKTPGTIIFHDTLMIDGCREFILDLRTKYNDGTFDIFNLPFGYDNKRKVGISVLVKRTYPVTDDPIIEVCGSISTERDIELREQEWYQNQLQQKKKEMHSLAEEDTMQFLDLGSHKDRKKYASTDTE